MPLYLEVFHAAATVSLGSVRCCFNDISHSHCVLQLLGRWIKLFKIINRLSLPTGDEQVLHALLDNDVVQLVKITMEGNKDNHELLQVRQRAALT